MNKRTKYFIILTNICFDLDLNSKNVTLRTKEPIGEYNKRTTLQNQKEYINSQEVSRR